MMGQPPRGVPMADLFQKTAQIDRRQRLRLPIGRFFSTKPPRVHVGDQLEGHRPDFRIEVTGLRVSERPTLENEIGSLADPVDGLDRRVEPLEVMNSLDESPLPSPVEVEVVDRSIS